MIVLEQLKKTQAHITIWSLLFDSKPHRAILIKLLDKSVNLPDSTPEQLPRMIGSFIVQRSLSFSNEDLSPHRRKHSLALHITVQTRGKFIPQVLINNGFTINICPLKMTKGLGILDFKLTPSIVTIRAYNNTRRVVLGSLDLDLLVGPGIFLGNFQIIDITLSFNHLLKRAWLHDIGHSFPRWIRRLRYLMSGKQLLLKRIQKGPYHS